MAQLKIFVQLTFTGNLDADEGEKSIFVELSNKDKQQLDKRRQYFPKSVAKFAEVQYDNSVDVECEKWFAEKEGLQDFIIAEFEA